MTGTVQSVLGVKSEIIVEKLKTKLPARYELAKGECKLEGVLFDIDEKSGLCNQSIRVSIR